MTEKERDPRRPTVTRRLVIEINDTEVEPPDLEWLGEMAEDVWRRKYDLTIELVKWDKP